MPEQPTWLIKAKDTYKFHREKRISSDRWTINMTAKALRRSPGSICEDLLLARWCKTHEVQLERFEYAYQALEFIRERQRKSNLDEID